MSRYPLTVVASIALVAALAAIPPPARAAVSLGGWMAHSPDDIPGTFTTLSGNDATSPTVTLPFTFTIEGTAYTTLVISTNGWIEFGGNTSGNSDPTNDCLPTGAHTNPFLAFYWDDMRTINTALRYGTVGSAGGRVFIVDVDFENNTADNNDVTMQVQLHERSNTITVRYRTAQPLADGQTATIGYQGAGGASATTVQPLTCNGKVLDDNRPDEGWSVDVGRAGQVTLAAMMQHSPDDISGFTTLTGDNNTASVTLPFSVTLEGTSYNTLALSTNGWIEFGGNTSGSSGPSNDCLPTASHTHPFLAAYWDDLNPFGTAIRYGTVGSSPNRVFIADYEVDLTNGNEGSDDLRFQVEIHERSSLINVRYRDKQSNANAQSATIGFQGAGGASAAAYPLTCNGKIIDDNDASREGWSIHPKASGAMSLHAVMAFSPDDVDSTNIPGLQSFSGNDVTQNATIPFAVRLDGVNYTTITMSTNGWVEFGGNTSGNSDPTNDCLPTSVHTNPFLAVFWDDMVTAGSSSIQYGTVGATPNRTFLIDYFLDTVVSSDDGGDDVKMQVQIHEGSNEINVKYYTAQALADGQTATIGFQSAGGASATATSVGCNAKMLDDNIDDSGWSISPLPICGNGVNEPTGGEDCDLGGSNGSGSTCCTATCQFRANGQVCRTGGGAPCDLNETCTGSASSCPADDAPGKAGITCRIGSGDFCDPDEVCNGQPGVACPADVITASGTLCRSGSGDVCDPDEQCTGVAGQACPANVVNGSSTICRPGSGDACDANETCSGIPGAQCPSNDAPFNAGVVCRAGSGDSCDLNETCTGTPGAQCPADDAPGKAGTVCRLSPVGDMCDGNESCSGIPGSTCPPDDAPGHINLLCRAGSGDMCDPDERCTGVAGQGCPQDEVANPTTVCRTGSGDSCDPDETCTAIPGQACPADVVSPAGTACREATGTCDVAEQCSGNAGEACPADAFTPADTPCDDDANVCTIDQCDGLGTCVFETSMTCGNGVVDGSCAEECDDGNTDAGDGCSATCLIESPLECSTAPRIDCRQPFIAGKASLLIKTGTTASRNLLKWKWVKGERTTLADYGDPRSTSDYRLCLYDSSGLRLTATAPAGGTCAFKPCWSALGTSGFKYKDKELTPDGIQQLKLKTGADGKAQIKLAARGENLALPGLSTLTQPLTVQLRNIDGVCWEAVYSAPALAHSSVLFKDKAD